MAAWSDGYFTDIQYTRKFFPHMAPGLLAFACLRQGIRPPNLGPGSTYLELGCGQGFGLNLLAAANPAMQFWGVDFHPGQIANAQQLAREGGLANIAFEDFSFSQVLDLPEGRIPRCDVIALHGVLSWVSSENRALIVRILDRYLKPGGMVMVSYNTLPAWAPLMPLRQFVKARFDRTVGPPQTRAVDAFRLAKELIALDARALGSSSQVKGLIEVALKSDPAYLIHEYMNDHFHPLYHADVARELDGARLTFAAAVNLSHDLISLAAPQPMQGLIQAETDPIWRETLLDYANNRRFRSDVFVRGPNALGRGERQALLDQVRFSLARAPGQVTFEFEIPIGSLKGDPGAYGAIVGALAKGPRSFGDLARLPPFDKASEEQLMKALGLLMTAGAVHPLAQGDGDADGARGFNGALLERLTIDNAPTYLAAPVIGAGVRVELLDLLALKGAADKASDHKAQARQSWEMMSAAGALLTKDGQILSDQAAHEAEILARLKAFEAEKLPLYRRLGVI
ncbi:MAG: class I SAM-dependent methyltransferase [Phenylobacterium sp.]